MRALRVALALAVGCAGCRSTPSGTSAPERLSVRAIDVGYGDAFLLTAGQTSILIDTGPSDAAPRLLAAMPPRLEALVLSHPHPDHAGGVAALARAGVQVGRVLHNPDPAWGASLVGLGRATPASRSTAPLELGPFRLTFLHPDEPALAREDPNDRSLVVALEWRGRTLLFPGDLVDLSLQAALCPALPRTLTVLKLPHHGDELADCLVERAEVLLLSVGENPYGLPRRRTLERHGARARRTDLGGDLLLELEPAE